MRPVPIAVIALVLLVTAACGGVENEPNLAKAVERTEATGSSRIEVRASLKDGDSAVALRCEGAADYERGHLQLDCNDGGDLITLGDTTYFKSSVFGVRADKTWIKVPLEERESVHNFSPEKLLTMLRDASVQTDRVGDEAVRDASTVRYRLTVNCEKAQIGCPGDTAPVDVWIDDEGLVRRIELEDDGSPATIEFFDFGVEVHIEPPPADQVAEIGEGWTGYGPSVDPSTAACSGEEAAPISENQALAKLRRHGLSIESKEQGCFGSVAAVLENKPDDFEQQGYVSCFLYAKQPAGAPTSVNRRDTDGGDARLALANLVCTILADSSNAEEKIRPLEQAFEELERAIRP